MEGVFAVIILALVAALEVVWMLFRELVPLELIIIILLLGLVILSIRKMGQRDFWKIMFIVFCANLLGLGYLYLKFGSGIILYACLMLSCIGLWLAIDGFGPRAKRRQLSATQRRDPEQRRVVPLRMRDSVGVEDEPNRYVINSLPEPPEYVEELFGSEPKKAEPAVTRRYSPGKFLATKTGRTYHSPKCEWAKKIRKDNQLWFASEKEADELGYKRHNCLN